MESKKFEDPFLNILPKLDLHGETRDTIRYLILDFLSMNVKMKRFKVQIIHGRHGTVLRKETHEILKRCPLVDKYYIYYQNDGITIVELKSKNI